MVDTSLPLTYSSPAFREPFCIDVADELRRLRERRSLTREPLVRALGGPSDATVVDATSGFLSDTLLLAASGFHVIALERHPTIFALSADALARAFKSGDTSTREACARIQHIMTDAEDWLASHGAESCFLDPMVDDERSAKPKKAMQVLRHLAPPQSSEARLLLRSARSACRRVVVKRPFHLPPLGLGRSSFIETRNVRFDVYLRI